MKIYTWEDYFIPGTRTLRNRFTRPNAPYGEPDPQVLHSLEEFAASLRLFELEYDPIPGGFDLSHMQAIHGYIFQDIYDWAGQLRTAPDTPMVKAGPDVVNFAPGDPRAPLVNYAYYPAGPAMIQAAHVQYQRIAELNYLRNMNHHDFVGYLGSIWCELNVIHTFREGNTRSQFVFFSQLCHFAGWHLDYQLFAPGQPGRDDFVGARFYGQATGKSSRLASVLSPAIRPLPHPDNTQGGF